MTEHEQLYRICPECDGKGFVGQDMCDMCLATDGPLGLIPVKMTLEETVCCRICRDDPDAPIPHEPDYYVAQRRWVSEWEAGDDA